MKAKDLKAFETHIPTNSTIITSRPVILPSSYEKLLESIDREVEDAYFKGRMEHLSPEKKKIYAESKVNPKYFGAVKINES